MEIFRRAEDKYICTEESASELLKLWRDYIQKDIYFHYSVHSVYFDNDQNSFALHSLNHPVFKVKMRLRSYGDPDENSTVYIELKKKFGDIVYKSRIGVTEKEAEDYVNYGIPLHHDGNTVSEIDYLLNYSNPYEKVLLIYERECWIGKEEPDVRITFDRRIRYRLQDISLHENGTETELLPGKVLLETKAENRYPLWLVRGLEKMQMRHQSFSKYGNVFMANAEELMKGENHA